MIQLDVVQRLRIRTWGQCNVKDDDDDGDGDDDDDDGDNDDDVED